MTYVYRANDGCVFIDPIGLPCAAKKMTGSQYCEWHDVPTVVDG